MEENKLKRMSDVMANELDTVQDLNFCFMQKVVVNIRLFKQLDSKMGC